MSRSRVLQSGASPGASEGSGVAKTFGVHDQHAFDLLYQLHTSGLKLCVEWRNAPPQELRTNSSLLQSSSESSDPQSSSQSPPFSSFPSSDTTSTPCTSGPKADNAPTAQIVSSPHPQYAAMSKRSSGGDDEGQEGFEALDAVLCIPLKNGSEAARLLVRRSDNGSLSEPFSSTIEFTLNRQSVIFLPSHQSHKNDTSPCLEDPSQECIVPSQEQDVITRVEQAKRTLSPIPVSTHGCEKGVDNSTQMKDETATLTPFSAPSHRSCPSHITLATGCKAPGRPEGIHSPCGGSSSFPDRQARSTSPQQPPLIESRPATTVSPASGAPVRVHSVSHAGPGEAGPSVYSLPSGTRFSSSSVKVASLLSGTSQLVPTSVPGGQCREAVLLKGPGGIEIMIRCRCFKPQASSFSTGSHNGPDARTNCRPHLPCTVVYEALRILQFYGFQQCALLSSLIPPSSYSKGCGGLEQVLLKLNLQVLRAETPASSDAIVSSEAPKEARTAAIHPVVSKKKEVPAPDSQMSSACAKSEEDGKQTAATQNAEAEGLPADDICSELCGHSEKECGLAPRPIPGACLSLASKRDLSECGKDDLRDGMDAQRLKPDVQESEKTQVGISGAFGRMLQSLGYPQGSADLTMVYLAAAGILGPKADGPISGNEACLPASSDSDQHKVLTHAANPPVSSNGGTNKYTCPHSAPAIQGSDQGKLKPLVSSNAKLPHVLPSSAQMSSPIQSLHANPLRSNVHQASYQSGDLNNLWPPVDSSEVTTASMVDSGPTASSDSCIPPKGTSERASPSIPEGSEVSHTSPNDSDHASRYRLAAVAAAALAAAVARKQRREASDCQAAETGQHAFCVASQQRSVEERVYQQNQVTRFPPGKRVLGGRPQEKKAEQKSQRGSDSRSNPLLQCWLLKGHEKASFPSSGHPSQGHTMLGGSQRSPEGAGTPEVFKCQNGEDRGQSFSTDQMEGQATTQSRRIQQCHTEQPPFVPGRDKRLLKQQESQEEWSSSTSWVNRRFGGGRRIPRMVTVSEEESQSPVASDVVRSGPQSAGHPIERNESETFKEKMLTARSEKSPIAGGDGTMVKTPLFSMNERQVQHTKGLQSASGYEPCDFPDNLRHLSDPLSKAYGRQIEKERSGSQRVTDSPNASALYEPHATFLRCRQALEKILEQHRTLNQLPGVRHGARVPPSIHRNASSAQMDLTDTIGSSLVGGGSMDVSSLPLPGKQLQVMAGVFGEESLQGYIRAISLLLDPRLNTSEGAVQLFSRLIADNQTSDEEDEQETPVVSSTHLAAPPSSPVSNEQARNNSGGEPKTSAELPTLQRVVGGFGRKPEKKESVVQASKTEQDFQRSGSGEMPTSSASAAATAAAVAALLSWKKAQSLRRISPDCDGSEKKNQFFESYAAHTQELLSRQRQQGRDKVGEAVSFTNACKQPVLRHTKQEKNLPQSALPRGVLLDAARVLLATSAQHSNNGGEALPLHQALVHLLLPKGNDRDGKKKDNEDMLDRLTHLHETHRQGPLPPENVSIQALRAKRSSSWNHSGFELRDKKSNSPLAYDNSSKKFSHSSPDHCTEGGRNANSREPSCLQPKDTPTDLDAHLTSHSVAATVNASDDEMIEATAAALKAIGRLLTLRASRRLPERQPSALLLPVNSPSKTYTADEACTGTQAIAPGSAVQKVTADLPVARNLSSHIRHILSTYVTSQKDAGVLSAALAAALRRDGPPSSDRVQALEVADAGCESGLPQYVDTHRPSRKRVQQPDEKTRESGRQECGVVFSTREKLEGGPTIVPPGKHVQSVSYGVPALHTGHIEAADSFTPQRLRLFQQLARLHGLPQINGRPGASFGEEENKLSVGKKGIVPQEKGQLSCNTARMSSSSPIPPLLSSDPEASSEASAEIHVCPAPPPSPAHAGLRVPKGPLQTAALPCSKGGQEQQRREDAHVIPGASRADCQGTGNTLWQQIPHRSSNSAAASSFATDQGVLQLLLQAHESLQRSLASNALKNKTDTRFLERRDFVLGKKKDRDHANRHHPDSSTQLTTSQRDAMNLLGFSSSRTQLEAEMLGGQPFNGPGGTTGATNQSDQQYGLHTQRQGSEENNQAQNQQIATKRSKPLNPYATPFVPRFALASSLSEEASSNSLTSADAATSGSRWGADITPVSSSPGPVPVATDASSFSVGRGKSQRFEAAGQFPLPSGSEKNPDILAALGAERGGSDSCESQKAVLENALHEILLQRRVASRRTDRSHRLCKLPAILQEDSQALLAVLRKQLAQTRDSEYGIRTLQLNHASQPLSQQLSETLAVKREQQRRGSDNVCTHGREREAHEDAWPQESFVSLVNKQLLRADEKLLPDASLPQTVVPKVTLAQKRQNLQTSVSSHHLLCTPPHTASGVHGEDASFLQSAAKRQPFRGGSQLHLSGLAVPDADLVTAESIREVTEKGKERVAVRKAAVQQGGEAEAGDFGSSVRNTNRPQTNTGDLSSALSKEHLTLLQLQHRMHALQLQSHQTRASSSANLERHPHSSPLPPQVDCPSSFGRQTRHPSLHSNNAPVAGEARLSQATLTAIHLNDSSSIDSIPPCLLVRSLPTRSSKNAAATGHSILLQEASRQKGAQRDAGVNPESLSTPPMRLPELHTHSSSDSYSVGNTAAAPVALTQAAPENARNEQATGRDSSAIDRKYHGGSSRIVLSQVDVNMKEPGRQEEVFGSHVPDTKGRILGPKKGDENSLSPTQQTHLLQTTLLALSRGGSSLSPALLAALGAAAASPETLLGHLRRLAAAEVKMPSRSEKVLGQVDPFRSVSSTSENTGEPSNEYSLPRSAPSRISEVHQGDDVAGERLPSPSQNLHLSQKGIYSKNQLLKLSRCLLQQQERKKKARTKAESSSGSGDDSADEETNMVRQSLPFVERFALPGETAPAGHAVRGLARGPLSPGMHAGPRILPAGRSKASAAPQGNKVASRVPPLLSNIFPLNAVKDELQTGGTVKVAVAPEGQAHSLSETGEKPAGTSTGTLSFASPSGATCGSSRPSSAASLLATVEGATRDAPDETANIRNTEGVEGKGSDAKPASHSSLRLPRRRGSVPTRDKGNDQKSSGVDGGIAGKHGVEGGNPSKRRGSTAFLVSVGSGKHASTTSASPCGPATKGLEPRLPKHVFAEDSERNTKAQTQKKTGEEDMPAAGEAVAKDSQSKQQTNAGMATQPRQGGGGKSRVGKRGSHTQRSNSSSFQDGHQPLSTRSKESSEKNDVSEAPDSSACPGSLADSQALQSASKNSPGADKGPEVGTMGCLQRQKKTQTAVETRANVEDQGLPEESENHTEEENLHKKVQHGAPQSHLVANYSASVDRHPLEEKEVVRDRSVASVSSCVCSSSETGKLEAIKPQTINPTASTGPKHHRKKKDTLGKPGQGLGGSVISKTRSHSDSKDTYKRSSMAGEAVLSVAGEARFSAVHRETRITSASSSSSDEICEMTKETKRNKDETEASATCVK